MGSLKFIDHTKNDQISDEDKKMKMVINFDKVSQFFFIEIEQKIFFHKNQKLRQLTEKLRKWRWDNF